MPFEPRLPAQCRPRMRKDVRVETRRRAVVLESLAWELIVEDERATQTAQLLLRLDGGATLEDVLAPLPVHAERLRSLVSSLYAEGAVADDSDAAIPASLFLRHVRGTATLWRANRNRDAPRFAVPSGRARIALVTGLLVERWHYQRTAATRLFAAASKATTSAMQQGWCRLAVTERSWTPRLEVGLLRLVPERQLRRAHPLHWTQSLCTHMLTLAQGDPLGYAACFGLGIPEEGNPEASFLRSMAEGDPAVEAAIAPFIEHAVALARTTCLDIIRTQFAEIQWIGPLQRRQILGHVWDHLALFDLYYTGVVEHVEQSERQPAVLHLGPFAGMDG